VYLQSIGFCYLNAHGEAEQSGWLIELPQGRIAIEEVVDVTALAHSAKGSSPQLRRG